MQNQKGLSTPLLIGIIALVILVGASFLFGGDEDEESPYATPEALQEYQEKVVGRPEAQKPINYSGRVLAGRVSPLLEFNRADYDAATAAGKLVLVYFTPKACNDQCGEGFLEMKTAFSQLDRPDVVGFIAEISNPIAKELGLFSSDSKIMLRNGEMLLKSPLFWSSEEILANIDAYTYSPGEE